MGVKSKFQLFRESKNETRKQLAEGLAAFNEDVESMERRIRNWEKRISMPTMKDLLTICQHYSISHKEVFDLFDENAAPVLNESSDTVTNLPISDIISEAFWNAASFEVFFSLINVFATLKYPGFITDKTGFRLFPFSKIQTDEDYDGSCIIFSDIHDRRVWLTESNMIAITPRSLSNGHFTFSLAVNYPVFPVEEVCNQNEFRQDIILTIFAPF